jgi:hypothetical protein
MSMESRGGMILTRKTEQLGEIPVPVPISEPQTHTGWKVREPGILR